MKTPYDKGKGIVLGVLALCLVLTASACARKDTVKVPPAETLAEEVPLRMDESDEPEIGSLIGNDPTKASQIDPLRFPSGPFEGQPIPADIKGSYTIVETAMIYSIPMDMLAGAFLIPPDRANLVRNGDLKHLYRDLLLKDKELGNGSVIMFVSMLKGIPFEPHEPTYLLEPGVDILKSFAKLSPEDLRYLEAHTVRMEEVERVYWEVLEQEEASYASDGALVINAQTNFWDLMDAGITLGQILEVLGAEVITDMEQPVREYCVLNKLQFSKVKEDFTRLLSN